MYAVNRFGNYQCPCCSYFTLGEGRSNTFDICSVCWWEDDGVQFDLPDMDGGANSPSLNEARQGFRRIGASEERWLSRVRPALPEEMPD
ncbi:CPCC family cysteine-rich protein [Hymenobacter psychrophilus]|uniref:CPCC family cysteine-rich protein n=1 Tax=Hymenobacter psychrophilus TaxID=651662 RepID=UPI000B86C172|nr:CPCC family cysteine-rich protein [Hymenobacter psychrophilus]